MKLGQWYINPSAVIAAHVYPRTSEPTIININVMGIAEPARFERGKTPDDVMAAALDFVLRLEACWGDGTPLFAAATASNDYAIDKDIMEALNNDRQTER